MHVEFAIADLHARQSAQVIRAEHHAIDDGPHGIGADDGAYPRCMLMLGGRRADGFR